MTEDWETETLDVTRGTARASHIDRAEGRPTQGSAVGFYLLLGIAALGLLVFVFASPSRHNAPHESEIVNPMPVYVPPVALTPPPDSAQDRDGPVPVAPEPALPPTPPPVSDAPSDATAGLSPPSDATAPSVPSAEAPIPAPGTPDGGSPDAGATTAPPMAAADAPTGSSVSSDGNTGPAATDAPTSPPTGSGQGRL